MSRPRSWRRGLALTAALFAVAVALGGCGAFTNTITPQPWTADHLTVELPSAPNANYVGLYDADALGYLKQADLDVKVTSAAAGSNSLQDLENSKVDIAVSSEPAVLMARNSGQALVSVAAIVRGPTVLQRVVSHGSGSGSGGGKTRHSKSSSSSSSSKKSTATVKYRTVPDLSALPQSLHGRTDLPTYDGLVFVVRKATIVNQPSLIRRFVQAVARGYRATRSDPATAAVNLVHAVPDLTGTKKLQEHAIRQALPSFFTPGKVWGWQKASQWNAFGTWLHRHGMIDNPNATPDASTNELLAGQGV